MKTYILDVNIVIKLWKDAPQVLDLIDQSDVIDYKITSDCLCELANGEIEKFFPRISPKYQKLLEHMINSPGSFSSEVVKENRYVREINGKLCVVVGNKVSTVDYGTIALCQNNPEYTLVTEDKKMLKSSKLVLNDCQILNYNQFIKELKPKGII